MNIDWRTILLNKDIYEQWTVFISKINDAIDKCVPKVKINSNTDIKSDKNCQCYCIYQYFMSIATFDWFIVAAEL